MQQHEGRDIENPSAAAPRISGAIPSGSLAAALAGSFRALLETLARAEGGSGLAPFLDEWPTAPQIREVAPSRELPVLRYLPTVLAACVDDDAAAAFAPALAACARVLCATAAAARAFCWRQTYTARDVGGEFLANYAWTEILGSRGPIAAPRVASGLLLLGPRTTYPRHRHVAEEIYVPLSGTADWQQGDHTWRSRRPATLIHHRSEEIHAMRTAAEPLLALYVWRATDAAGADLGSSARLES
jgi:hypothetical protein